MYLMYTPTCVHVWNGRKSLKIYLYRAEEGEMYRESFFFLRRLSFSRRECLINGIESKFFFLQEDGVTDWLCHPFFLALQIPLHSMNPFFYP